MLTRESFASPLFTILLYMLFFMEPAKRVQPKIATFRLQGGIEQKKSLIWLPSQLCLTTSTLEYDDFRPCEIWEYQCRTMISCRPGHRF